MPLVKIHLVEGPDPVLYPKGLPGKGDGEPRVVSEEPAASYPVARLMQLEQKGLPGL